MYIQDIQASIGKARWSAALCVVLEFYEMCYTFFEAGAFKLLKFFKIPTLKVS